MASDIKTINIYGDSFGASNNSSSWSKLLSDKFTVSNFCFNGSSEYRIYKTLKNTYDRNVDLYIIVHTNPYRVFIEKNLFYLTSDTHKHCDLILADVEAKKTSMFGKAIHSFFKYVYSSDYTYDISNMCIDASIQILCNKKTIHITNFKESIREGFIYFDYLNSNNKGCINHYNEEQNKIIYQTIIENINAY